MEIDFEQLDAHTRQISLAGRLDLKGTDEISQRFTALTATDDSAVLVDMSGVEFIASIGMRLLLSCAKAKDQRGGRMVLTAPQPLVREALEMAGIDTLIPIHTDREAALAILKS